MKGLKHFIQVGEHSLDSFLFEKISHTKTGFKLRQQKLSYSKALKLFKKQLKRKHLGPDRLIMRHGGWYQKDPRTDISINPLTPS